MKYIIHPYNIPVNLTADILQNTGITQRAIKSAFTRAKIDWVSILLPVKSCAWCNKPNSTIIFKLNIVETVITIEFGGYTKDLYCCFSKNCAYKKLNPNSAEFVSLSRAISHEEAIKYIHARNASPFYAENYTNAQEYIKYQGTRCFTSDEVRNKIIIEKQNYSRSLAGFVERFGEDGETKWNALQKQKAITLANLTRKHGPDALEKLIAWKNSTSCSLENFIRRHGKDKGPELYKLAVAGHGYYSPVTFTEGNKALRSNLERNFYEMLILAGLKENTDFFVDSNYPNSAHRYDFYFPKINVFVEICGCTTKEYRDKMLYKKDTYGALLVYPGKLKQTAKEIINICLSKSTNQI